MNEQKHTPGPWTLEGHFVPSVCATHETGRPVHIASVMKRSSARPGDTITEQEGEANARLIAAAPDLYTLATHPVLEWLLSEGIETIPEPQRTSVKLFLVPLWLAATAKAERRS